MATVRELVLAGAESLKAVTDVPRLEAEVLLASVLGVERFGLISRLHDAVAPAEEEKFKSLLEKRLRNVPVSYLTGTREFFGLVFEVNESTLIPRPETELLVEKTLEGVSTLKSPLRIIDLGTGSGCIAISIAVQLRRSGRKDFSIIALDRSESALQVAARNATTHGVRDVVSFIASDWMSALRPEPVFDIVVSNPPYIEAGETLAPDLSYEPKSALFAGSDGLDAYRELIAGVPKILAPGGKALFEIGAAQGSALERLTQGSANLRFVELYKDLSNRNRVVELERT